MTAIPINGETWAICGGRDFADQEMFDGAMGQILELHGCPSRIIHGDAGRVDPKSGKVFGADKMAGEWGRRMAIEVISVPADWQMHHKGAGPIRNQLMLDKYKPSVVVAFPGGKGTADMVRRSQKAGIDVIEIKENCQ